MRRKLLADGEGWGEDRRMSSLIKSVFALFLTNNGHSIAPFIVPSNNSAIAANHNHVINENSTNGAAASAVIVGDNSSAISGADFPAAVGDSSATSTSTIYHLSADELQQQQKLQNLKVNFYKIQNFLEQCETSATKSALIQTTTEDELKLYEQVSKKIAVEIEMAHGRIAECKRELVEAKQIRKQKQEYDALGALIKKHPARDETHRRLEALKQQKKLVMEKRDRCARRLEERKKHLHVLLISLQEITNLVRSDNTTD